MHPIFSVFDRFHRDNLSRHVFDEVIAPHVTGQAGNTNIASRDDLVRSWQIRRDACQQIDLELDVFGTSSRRVAAYYTFGARLVGPLDGVFPVGQRVDISGVMHCAFERGLLVEYIDPWEVFDEALLASQGEAAETSTPVSASLDITPEHAKWAKQLGLPRHLARMAGHLLVGFSPEEIAQHEGLALSTVRTYIRNLYAQIGVSTRGQAVRYLVGIVRHHDTSC